MKVRAVFLACCVILWTSTLAAGQGLIPFKAMMQSPGAAQVAAPMTNGDRHQTLSASTSTARVGALTPKGKGMIIGGVVLVAVGAVVVAADAAFGSTMGTKGTEGRTAAGYVGGVAAAGTGVTLIIFGSRNRSK